MKSHVLLIGRVLEDLSIRCCVSTTRDLKTVASRVEKEGEAFLTLALPGLAQYLELALDMGRLISTEDWVRGNDTFEVPPAVPAHGQHTHDVEPYHRDGIVGFRCRRGTRLPQFLFGLFEKIFDANSGLLLDDPDIDAIQGIRQVCNLFKSILHPCSDAKVTMAFDQYVECDNQVGVFMRSKEFRDELPAFRRLSELAFGDLFRDFDLMIWSGDSITPKHGPGATADRLKANAKYDNRLWTTRLEELFFAGDFLYPSWSHFLESEDRGDGPVWLEPGQELPVRVVQVPKTLKTPRIIAIEPTHMQYVQQGLAEMIVRGIQSDDLLKNFIGFDDQEPNRTMACQGSRDQDLATLDLSEASDRVSMMHVRALFARQPWLSRGVAACRSRKASVPGHGDVLLSKFASMGSALTFPIEAMVFFTIVLVGIEKELNSKMTRKDLQALIGRVRVYGDDIIVPVEYARSVANTLEDFGLRVNTRKSFWIGKFRESCGGDFYDGCDVGYVKVRRDLPSERKHVREIISTVELRNLMYHRGYWRTAEYLDELLGRLIPFPRVGQDSPGLGRHSYLGYDVERECPFLQRPLVKAAVVQSKIPESKLSGSGALLKYFLKRSDEPTADKRHLERAGRPVSVNIKTRWVSSF